MQILIIYGMLLFVGCKTNHIIKTDLLSNDLYEYSKVLSQISKLELTNYEKQHLFYERVLFNIDSNSLSFLFSNSINADSTRKHLNKLYAFNKIFNTIYKKDKTKFYPLTQELDNLYYSQLNLYNCKTDSLDARSKCRLIQKELVNKSLNKIETFIGETSITLLSNYSIQTDTKSFYLKDRKVEYSILKIIRPWFKKGILSMIYNSSKNKIGENIFLINQVVLMHKKDNKMVILGYVLEPI